MRKYYLLLAVIVAVTGCGKSTGSADTGTATTTAGSTTSTTTHIAKGVDLSWLTQMEASGYKFYNSSGVQQDCMQLMKDKGITAIRLRAWVNPSDGWCNTADVIAKALRAQKLGLKIMIDFHYSDSWADPGQQNKPVAWASLNFATLLTTLRDYTTSVMTALKTNGITPDWVQVGNETDDGILWEDGRASKHMDNFTALINAGYNAVKAVSPTTLVIVHVSNGYNNSLFRYIFDGLKANNAKWDVIGMSLYPTTANWQTLDNQCLDNMNDMIARYNTPVMVVEVGMAASEAATCKLFLTDIINKVNNIGNSQGLGVFYWEPEAYNWQGYGLGAFDATGKPTVAMDAFLN